MSKFIVVRTKDSKSWNADNQHDCAGTWVPNSLQKDEYSQLKAAKGVEHLVHIKNGVFNTIYKVNGYHTERRDYTYRQILEMSEGKVSIDALKDIGLDVSKRAKNSVGLRFHLEVIDDENEFNLVKQQFDTVDLNTVQGCKIFNL